MHASMPLRPRRTMLLVLLLALVVTTTGLTSGFIEADAAIKPGDYRRQELRATQNVRDYHDLNRLPLDRCLLNQAQRWAKHLAKTGRFGHQDLSKVRRRCNLRYVSENLALGYRNGHQAVRAWLHSPGHRQNLLEPRARIVGVGAKQHPDGWVAVQLIGRR